MGIRARACDDRFSAHRRVIPSLRASRKRDRRVSRFCRTELHGGRTDAGMLLSNGRQRVRRSARTSNLTRSRFSPWAVVAALQAKPPPGTPVLERAFERCGARAVRRRKSRGRRVEPRPRPRCASSPTAEPGRPGTQVRAASGRSWPACGPAARFPWLNIRNRPADEFRARRRSAFRLHLGARILRVDAHHWPRSEDMIDGKVGRSENAAPIAPGSP